jgi:RNA polymerase sigma factor, sigma-70 family
MATEFDQKLLHQWVSELKAGNHGVQARIYTAVSARLLRFCRLLSHNREIAEDIAQEAILKSFHRIEHLEKPEQYLSWLYQIAKNSYLDQQRRLSQFHKITKLHTGESQHAYPNEQTLEIKELIRFMNLEDRSLFLLIELEERSYKEVATILNISEDAVRSKLHRLRMSFLKTPGNKAA